MRQYEAALQTNSNRLSVSGVTRDDERHNALEKLLPPKTKMALLMVRQEGLSYEEVASKLGIKTHSARRLVERAMEYLLEAVPQEKHNFK